jgi:hypothetical protein
MDSSVATQLAAKLHQVHQPLGRRVAQRLLQAYPELTQALRLEESYPAVDRLSEVAVERLLELVRSVLLFELPSLADSELRWAVQVLPSSGVTYQHQSSMVRWFFEEVRQLQLSAAELQLSHELERYFLKVVTHVYSSLQAGGRP